MLERKSLLKRLDKAEIVKLEELADQMNTAGINNRERINNILGKLHLLPFRKMKFSSALYTEQNDERLVQKLRDKFGSDAVIVLGDWSAPNLKFQEPNRRCISRNRLSAHNKLCRDYFSDTPVYTVTMFRRSLFLKIVETFKKKDPQIHKNHLVLNCSQYPNQLKVTKVIMDRSEKIKIGSKTMNILAVSSIRIDDSKLAPEVGPPTMDFIPSQSTQYLFRIL